jgi:hypothetical protein
MLAVEVTLRLVESAAASRPRRADGDDRGYFRCAAVSIRIEVS